MYFIDVQGTLIDDRRHLPLPGAREFIARLNETGTPYLVVTNNTKRPSAEFLAYLGSIGFAIDAAPYLDALTMLERVLPAQGGVAAYGTEGFVAQVAATGYRLDYETPRSVLLSVGTPYDGDTFARIVGFLTAGATLFGMHETTLYVQDGRRYPGVGALLRMFAFAADVPYRVVGKPSELFYTEALRRLRNFAPEASFSDVTMISDDYAGDLTGAAALGMRTALVLTGKTGPDDPVVQRLRSEGGGGLVYNDVTNVLREE
jgi:NagD protein